MRSLRQKRKLPGPIRAKSDKKTWRLVNWVETPKVSCRIQLPKKGRTKGDAGGSKNRCLAGERGVKIRGVKKIKGFGLAKKKRAYLLTHYRVDIIVEN